MMKNRTMGTRSRSKKGRSKKFVVSVVNNEESEKMAKKQTGGVDGMVKNRVMGALKRGTYSRLIGQTIGCWRCQSVLGKWAKNNTKDNQDKIDMVAVATAGGAAGSTIQQM